jgi:UDP-glucose 4-epimerase
VVSNAQAADPAGVGKILVTGGMGFIGLHTARALVDLGHRCVITAHRTVREPDFINDEIDERVLIERVDVADRAAVLELAERHRICGIVHLADPTLTHLFEPEVSASTLIDDWRRGVGALLNVLEAASEWDAGRVTVISTIGVYGGLEDMGGLREDVPLPLVGGGNPVAISKMTAELLSGFLADRIGLQLVTARLPAVWGPLGRTSSRFFAAPALIHAAARAAPRNSNTREAIYAEDAIDMLYVKDCARAIALLHTSKQLRHTTYNVGSGRATSNRAVVEAIGNVTRDTRPELRLGRSPQGPGQDIYLDTTRLRRDTGFEPRYELAAAVADYIDWLRAGNDQ